MSARIAVRSNGLRYTLRVLKIMNERRTNKLFVAIGLLLAGNGLLLSATPARFASLRTMGWLPDQYNTTLKRVTSNDRSARAMGAAAAILGVVLVTLGVRRTKPVT